MRITEELLDGHLTKMMKHFNFLDENGNRVIGFAAQMTYGQWENKKLRRRISKRLGKASNFAEYTGKHAIPLVGGLWVFVREGDAKAAGKEVFLDLSGLDILIMGGQALAAITDELQSQIDECVANSPAFKDGGRNGERDRVTRTRMHGIRISPDGRILD